MTLPQSASLEGDNRSSKPIRPAQCPSPELNFQIKQVGISSAESSSFDLSTGRYRTDVHKTRWL